MGRTEKEKREIEGRRREIAAGKLTSEGKGDASVIKAEKRKGHQREGGFGKERKQEQRQKSGKTSRGNLIFMANKKRR